MPLTTKVFTGWESDVSDFFFILKVSLIHTSVMGMLAGSKDCRRL